MTRTRAGWLFAVVLMLLAAVPLAAQTADGTVIAIGETKAAAVSAGSPTAVFVVESGAPWHRPADSCRASAWLIRRELRFRRLTTRLARRLCRQTST